MARILLPLSPLASRRFITHVQAAIDLRDDLVQTKQILDEITSGGTDKAALENDPEVIGTGPVLQAGQGALLYDAVNTLLNGVNSASALLIYRQFDQG